jgi:tetratricopeptide (TPR) repeat protein
LAWPLVFEPSVDLLPFAVFALVASAAIALRGAPLVTKRGAVAGAAWAVFSYLPSSNLIPLTRYLADSYVYLPLSGLALALASAATPFERSQSAAWRAARVPMRRRLVLVPAVILLAALSLSARRAAAHFASDIALWRQAYERYPNDYRLCRNLGNAYVDAGQPIAALELYENCAARIAREPFRKNIAIVLFTLGLRDEARAAFLQLLAENPADPVVRKYLALLGDAGGR